MRARSNQYSGHSVTNPRSKYSDISIPQLVTKSSNSPREKMLILHEDRMGRLRTNPDLLIANNTGACEEFE